MDSLTKHDYPTPKAISRLRDHLALPRGAADVYLAYGPVPSRALHGLLVAGNGGIDEVIAYCPLGQSAVPGHREWSNEVLRQCAVARRIAASPETARSAPDAVWLGYATFGDRDVPAWVYALACIPLTREWDGEPISPRPFSPDMFARMAIQPAAAHWLRRHNDLSPLRAAGRVDGAPAAQG